MSRSVERLLRSAAHSREDFRDYRWRSVRRARNRALRRAARLELRLEA